MYNAKTRIIFDRKKQGSSEKRAPFSIEVLYKGKRKYYSTGISVYPHQWDFNRQKIVKHPQAQQLTEKLFNTLNNIDKAINGLNVFSFEILDEKLKNPYNNDIYNIIMHVYNLPKGSTSYAGYPRLKYIAKNIKEFKDLQYVENITTESLQSYITYLVGKGYCPDIVKSYINVIKKCTSPYLSTLSVFNNLELPKSKKKARKFLTAEQLDNINNVVDLEVLPSTPQRALTLFLFQCYTGLSFSDTLNVNINNFTLNAATGLLEGSLFRKKTKEPFFLVLLPRARALLERLGGSADLGYKSAPAVNNILQSKKVKGVIGGLHLSTHMGRHTFATTVTLQNNVPLHVVSKMLGHSKILTTQIYAKMVNQSVRNEYIKLSKVLKEK